MRIGLRGGHSPNSKGAIKFLDEQVEVRKIYEYLADIEKIHAGVEVVDCNSNASTVFGELNEGEAKANNNNVDEFFAVHMNAGGGTGAEIWLYDDKCQIMNRQAEQILKNLHYYFDLNNRGIKYSKSLADLYRTRMPAAIIEVCFVDNQHDVDIYRNFGPKMIADAIAGGISERDGFIYNYDGSLKNNQKTKKEKEVKTDRWVTYNGIKCHIDKEIIYE